jgi:cell cycle checkpoint control protein RAD9A
MLSSQSQRKPLRPQSFKPVLQEPEPDEDSLFMPAGDDERTWDPPNFDQEEEEEEMLGWDATNEMRGSEPHPTFRDSAKSAPQSKQGEQQKQNQSQWEDGLEPTQRLSQVRLPLSSQSQIKARLLMSALVAWNVRLRSQRSQPHELPLKFPRSR